MEGLYWRYEMALRAMESGLAGITAGNGGIYAVAATPHRARSQPGGHRLPVRDHQRGRRAVYEPTAVAEANGANGGGRVQAQAAHDVGAVGRDAGWGMLNPRIQPPTRSRSCTACAAT